MVTQADDARKAGRLDEAIQRYSQGVGRRPAWNEGWWWLASLLYEQDRFSEAQTSFARFVKLDPHPGPGYAFLALCEYETQDYDRALEDFQAWSKYGSPGNDDLLDVAGYHWALLLTRKGQFAEALYLLAAKAKKLGASPALVEAMGLASLRMANLPEDYPPAKRELVWLAGSAAVYGTRDDANRSSEFAHRLAIRYGGEANVHYFLGTLLGFQGNLREAAEEFKGELRINPRHVPALIELALVYIGDLQPADAVSVARQAVELDPNNGRARYALGKSLLDTDQFTESARELEMAKQLKPNSAQVRSALSSAYRHLGRMEEAKREAAAFLSLNDKQEVLAPLQDTRSSSKAAPGKPEHDQ